LGDFVTFINAQSGTRRLESGRLDDQAGRVKSLDDVADKFLEASDKAALVKEAEHIVADLPEQERSTADFYVKYMKAIEKKGASVVESESDRLNKMLNGNLTPAKSDEFVIRKNILSQFK